MDDKLKNNDIIYYQLDGGFIQRIRNWLQQSKKDKNTDTFDIQTISNIPYGIKLQKSNKCYPIDTSPTCNITDTQINNITKFLAHKLPTCKQLNISLENIKTGQIISSGSFGYTFKVTDKIIKIILCDKENKKEIENEINIHKSLMKTQQNKYFIKLYGYIKRNYNKYKYYDINSKNLCSFNVDNQECELYVFLEAGIIDLETKLSKFLNLSDSLNDMINKTKIKAVMTNKFYELLNFYTVSAELLKTKKVFIHADIKPENIVCVKKLDSDSEYDLKLIDFGLSHLSNKFIVNSGCSPLYYYYYMGKETKSYFTSPVYDVFCLILSYVQFLLPKSIFKYNISYSYTKLINNIKILPDESIKLKMYKLICIGWLFQGGITNKIYIINREMISCNSCDSTKKMYEYMDKIIKAVCACTTIQQIESIKCNDIIFTSILDR